MNSFAIFSLLVAVLCAGNVAAKTGVKIGGTTGSNALSPFWYYPGSYAGSCVQLAAQAVKGHTCVDKGKVMTYPYYVKWSPNTANNTIVYSNVKDASKLTTSAKRTWGTSAAALPPVLYSVFQSTASGILSHCVQAPAALGTRRFRMFAEYQGSTLTLVEEGAVYYNATLGNGCQPTANPGLFCNPQGYNYRCVLYALPKVA